MAFDDTTSQAQSTQKNGNCDFTKIKDFCYMWKTLLSDGKDKPQVGRKYLQKIFDKRLTSKL